MANFLTGIFHRVINRVLAQNAEYNKRRTNERLGAVGKGSKFDNKVEFKGYLKNIRIGNNVRIVGAVTIDCDSENASVTIGDNCTITGPSQILTYGGNIEIGNNASVNPFCIIYGHGGLKIGNYVRIATHTVIIPANHIFADADQPITSQGLSKEGITIGNDVWIGGGVRVLDGSVIGDGCVLGASTVVNGKFEPYSIIVGIPGKKIKSRKN